jgi:catechol 2,3-dioxygenase-like lactoylglutathione lyase family enzyme
MTNGRAQGDKGEEGRMAGAPPVQRLEHWTLVTSDMEKTKHFYKEVLGAETPQRPGGVGPESVKFGNTTIDFFPATNGRTPSPGTGGQHHAYVINLEDYDRWVEHLQQHGVEMQRRRHGLRWMSIYVDDPDGYHLELTVPFDDDEAGRRELEKRGLLRE